MSASATGARSRRTAILTIVCACLIVCISYGARAGMGLYLQPISLEYGWGRSTFSNSVAIQMLSLGILGPLAGALADRWGSARVVAVGGVMYALGLAAMSHVREPVLMYLVSGILIGGALACTSFAVVFSVVSRVVPSERRSTAFGIATAAGSFGQFSLLPLTQFLINRFDWHGALVGMSAITAFIVPLAVVLAVGARGAPQPAATTGAQTISGALKEAWGERGFHFLFWGYSVCGFQLTMLTIHLPAFVTDAGMSPKHGVIALALIGLFNIIGSICAGWLGGLFSKKYLLASIYMTRSSLLLVLLLVPLSPAVLYVFAAAMGLLWLGTVPLTNGLVGQVFGVRYMAMLGSVVFLGHQIGSFAGSMLAGYVFDATGAYTAALVAAIGMGLLAGILHIPVNESPIAERRTAAV